MNKKIITVLITLATTLFIYPQITQAHGGGLDGDGGHNCYVGSCAGTYHYHRSNPVSIPYVPIATCITDDNIWTISELKHLQYNLKLLGYYSGPIDGIWGNQSRLAFNKARINGFDIEPYLYIKCSSYTLTPPSISTPKSSTNSSPYPGYNDNIDQDCSDIRRKVWVGSYDPDRLDADGNGWGCESYG